MINTFQYRLYPTSSQRKLMDSTIETCRRFYNDYLAERKTAYEERKESIGKFTQLRKVKTLKKTNPYAEKFIPMFCRTRFPTWIMRFKPFFAG